MSFALLWGLIHTIDDRYGYFAALFNHVGSLAPVVSAFSFTILGFMTVVVTMMFNYKDDNAFVKFEELGWLKLFFRTFYAIMVVLLVTFVLSLLSFEYKWAFELMFAGLFINMLGLFYVIRFLVNLVSPD